MSRIIFTHFDGSASDMLFCVDLLFLQRNSTIQSLLLLSLFLSSGEIGKVAKVNIFDSVERLV